MDVVESEMIRVERERQAEIKDKFNKVHGSRYTYDNMYYINAHIKIKITCKDHGDFSQLPANHIKGHGCPKCKAKDSRRDQAEIFVQFNKVHNNKYDYSDSEYTGMANKININCPDHGIFEQKAQNHLSGNGCKQCFLKEKEEQRIAKAEYVFKLCSFIHAERYDYSKTEYQRDDYKFTAVCKEHGEFEIVPRSHMLGMMCPTCKQLYKAEKKNIKDRLMAIRKGEVVL